MADSAIVDKDGMKDFWWFARGLLRPRHEAIIALIGAFVSAGGMGAGLLSLGPLLQLILKDGTSLQQIVRNFNAKGEWFHVPEWFVNVLPADPYGGVICILAGLCALTVFGATANFIHQLVSMGLCARTTAKIRLEVFRHVIHLPLSIVTRQGPAEFTSRINNDVSRLNSGFEALTSKTISQVTKGAAAFGAAIYFDWRLVFVSCTVGPLLAIVLRKTGKSIRKGTRGALEAQESLLRTTQESMQGLRTMKGSTAELESIRRFAFFNHKVLRQNLRVRKTRALSGPLIEMLAIFVVVTGAGVGNLRERRTTRWRSRVRGSLAGKSKGFVDDGVRERADVFDFDAHGVAGFQEDGRRAGEADAVRRASENHGAGEERRAGAQEFDDRGDIEDHVVGIPILQGVAVKDRADTEGIRIGNFVAGDEYGAEWREGIEGLAAAPLAAAAVALPVAGGDIVGAGVTEDVGEGVGAGDVFATLANDDGELALVVDGSAGKFDRDFDGVAGVLRAGGILNEEHGIRRRRQVTLGGVAFVVEADAREEDGHDGGEELAGRDDAVGDTEVAVDIAGDFASGAVGLERGVGGSGGGEVADDFHVDLGEMRSIPRRPKCGAAARRCRSWL